VRENIVEAKHRRLVRGHRTTPLDRELKPDPKIRDELNVRPDLPGLSDLIRKHQDILRYPPIQPLTSPQRDLIWRYRFYLCRDKRALTKFLKSVVWSDPSEINQAVEELLPSWTDVEMEDALELLGPGEAFRDRRVRAYAVRQISRVDDEVRVLPTLALL
jgi:phosphatidylinositol 3-kinase